MTLSLLPLSDPDEDRKVERAFGQRAEIYLPAFDTLSQLYNPATVRTDFLPVLAKAFRVDFWDEQLSESEKRNLLAQTIQLHRHKGTRWAVERVLEILGVEGEILEWFEPGDIFGEQRNTEPYTFTVLAWVSKMTTTAGVLLSQTGLERLVRLVHLYKNARSHFELIYAALFLSGAKVLSTVSKVGVTTSLEFAKKEDLGIASGLALSGCVSCVEVACG